jgi:hypothetical protein
MKLEIELTEAKVLLGAVLAVAKQNCFGLLAEQLINKIALQIKNEEIKNEKKPAVVDPVGE